MKINNLLIAGVISIQLLASCTAIRINEVEPYNSSEFLFGTNKTALLVSSDEVLVNEFSKTFNKKYKQKEDFIHQFDSLFAVTLKNDNIFGTIKYDKSLELLSNDTFSVDQEQQKKVDSLFTNLTADYLIRILRHEITNSIQGNPGVMMPMAGGGMGMRGGGQSESCIVNSHFQIYDVKTRKKVLDFVSKGSAGVGLFAFEQALNNAIGNSIKNSVIYLKTGNIKF
ncbi:MULTISPECIES: hypothetical protein [unclassified Flavobacterium]|uniref:hypothetical protein n=1 Tax=unclassified Flavobacterium TaxID=196869 RepID=UPI00131E2590|nr:MULTISPECIES: hypothetical protein [unclassified Flavobacterium]